MLQETTGNPWNWKQYSGWKLSPIFPLDSCQLRVRDDRNRPDIIGKSLNNFRPEYCFHVLAISGIFRPAPARIYSPSSITNGYRLLKEEKYY
jgi:hypothetical protein